MLATKVFFSFTEIPDPTQHRAYNEWHQLDHRPENLALPGVLYGERWVKSPECAAVSSASEPRFEGFHYLNMYWLREPIEQSRREWQDLGSRSFQWGRRPDITIARRNHLQFCDPVKGYANPRVLVNEDVLPLRPNMGIWLTVSRLVCDEPTADDLFRWYDQVRIPDLLQCPGVAGAWTFVSEESFGPYKTTDTGPLRIHLCYLDQDPLEFAHNLAEHETRWETEGRGRDTSADEVLLFRGPLLRIIPWDWGWFDHA